MRTTLPIPLLTFQSFSEAPRFPGKNAKTRCPVEGQESTVPLTDEHHAICIGQKYTENETHMVVATREMTLILDEIGQGSDEAKAELMQKAYEELQQLACGMMRRERSDHTLQPTALVNEAAMRMLGQLTELGGRDRAYFYGAMATAMRRVLVDHARRKNASRRGGSEYKKQGLDYAIEFVQEDAKTDLLALDEALEQLSTMNARQSEVVSLRFFGGMTVPEIAAHLDVSVSTIEKDWRIARAWLHTQLKRE